MPKKMRMVFALLITLPLILSLSEEPGKTQPKYFNDFFDIIKKKVEEFKDKTEEEKDKILNELDSSIIGLNKEIKAGNSEKKEKLNEKIIQLLEKGIELSKYITSKVCQKEDKNYQNCINNKRKWINNLIDAVEDNYGQCSLAIEHITGLTNNPDFNLGYAFNLFGSIVDNRSYIEKSKISMISNILKCLFEKMDSYWSTITTQLGDENLSMVIGVALLKSIMNLHLKLYEDNNNDEIAVNFQKGYRFNEVLSDSLKDYVNKEISETLKEMNGAKNEETKDITFLIISYCVAAITMFIIGFILYRYIRSRKNSEHIENKKDFVVSENK